jgi:two-component system, chemotaxis family, chemotaxis protein CheY
LLRNVFSAFSPKKLCLVADSSALIRHAARRILRDVQLQVVEAENGIEALNRCHHHLPDAILLDGTMPEMDSFEFLEALHEHWTDSLPKIIFCTTERDPSRIARAIDAGAHEYVIKPFDRSILIAKLQKLGLVEAAPRCDPAIRNVYA